MNKPSTPLGNMLGWAVVKAARLADYHVPLAGIRLYWLIPAKTRGDLFGGPSGSREVASRIRAAGGGGWGIMVAWMNGNHPPRPDLP